MEMICALMFIICNHYGIKCHSNQLLLEPRSVMFTVISDIMAHWCDMWNTIFIATNFCNAKKMICALLFIISNQYGIKCLNILFYFLIEPGNIMFKVISDMAHCNLMLNIILIAIKLCNVKKMICTLMIIISNHYGIKCLINLV